MSRATIRAAMVAWLAPPNVAGINTVYRGQPKIIPGQAFFNPATPGVQAGCVCCISIPAEREIRKAIGGATSGKKRVDYTVDFILLYRYDARTTTVGGDAALDATDGFDAIVEALKLRIRQDRTANSSAIWQWGEAELSARYGDMKPTPQGLEQWGQIRTVVTEWLTT